MRTLTPQQQIDLAAEGKPAEMLMELYHAELSQKN